MALQGFTDIPMLPLRGVWSSLDHVEPEVERGRAYEARNVRFFPGRVRTRDGFAAGYAVSARTPWFKQWKTKIYGLGRQNFFLDYTGTTMRLKNLATADPFSTILTTSAWGVSDAEIADKLYVCFHDSTQIGLGHAYSVSPLNGGTADKAFGGPYSATVTVTASAAASGWTEGAHQFGYLVEYRSGHISGLGPVVTGTFAPTDFTITAGNHALTASVTSNTTADVAYYHFIMNRVDNPNRWYLIPGATAAVPPGQTGAVVSISLAAITDEDLAARATEVDSTWQLKLVRSGDTPPIRPHFVEPYGNRMVYGTQDKAYISDAYDYEYITESQHTVELPKGRPLVTGKQIGDVFYWFGSNWTRASSDTGERPRAWPAPSVISDAIGTASIHGVEARTAGDMAWVAAKQGLFAFNGQYPSLPVTHMMQKDWDKINWTAAESIVVRDDTARRRVYVTVPVGASQTPNKVYVIDYSRGMGPFDVDFSIDDISGVNPVYLDFVEDAESVARLWWSPDASGTYWNETPERRYDGSGAIVSVYESGYLMPPGNAEPLQFERAVLDLAGEGTAKVDFIKKDRVRSVQLRDVILTPTPEKPVYRGVQQIAANATLRVTTESEGAWFELRSVNADMKRYGNQW